MDCFCHTPDFEPPPQPHKEIFTTAKSSREKLWAGKESIQKDPGLVERVLFGATEQEIQNQGKFSVRKATPEPRHRSEAKSREKRVLAPPSAFFKLFHPSREPQFVMEPKERRLEFIQTCQTVCGNPRVREKSIVPLKDIYRSMKRIVIHLIAVLNLKTAFWKSQGRAGVLATIHASPPTLSATGRGKETIQLCLT